jgi:hypothetical protein
MQLIDESNAADPHQELEICTGLTVPKELLYAHRMTDMLERFAPDASEAVRIGVRAQHIQRWMIPRSSYPKTPFGYKQWRTHLYRYHADTTGALMHTAGYDEEMIARVKAIIGKLGIKVNPETQLLEDIAGLVFLEHYLKGFADAHPEYDTEKWLGILQKTCKKMSPSGRAFALKKIHLPESLAEWVIQTARTDSTNPPHE